MSKVIFIVFTSFTDNCKMGEYGILRLLTRLLFYARTYSICKAIIAQASASAKA
jgi:hypothetical protein